MRECWLAHERLRMSEARSINRAEILTARTDAAAEPRKLPPPWRLSLTISFR